MKSITLLAFSKTGKVKQLTLSRQVLLLTIVFVVATAMGSAFALFASFKGWFETVRLTSFKEENQLLRSELKKQAVLLDHLKGELKRLKNLEEQLRVLAGFQASSDPFFSPGEGGGGQLQRRGNEGK